MKYLLALLLTTSLAFAATPKPPSGLCIDDNCVPEPLPVSFYGDFEEGALNLKEFAPHIHGSANTLKVLSPTARSGAYALKSYIKRVDSSSYRSEAITLAPDPYWGKDTWYAFSYYIPADYAVDPLSEILAQWHHRPDAGEPYANPPVYFALKDGAFYLSVRWNDTDQPRQDSNGSWIYTGSRTHKLWSQFESAGRWTDIVLRIRWNYFASGSPGYTLWKSGVKVLEIQGPVGYKDARPPDFRVGLYKSLWKRSYTPGITERMVWYDEVRMDRDSGSYTSVAPKGAAVVAAN